MGIYKENKNLMNKIAKNLEKKVIESGLERTIDRVVYPVNQLIKDIPFHIKVTIKQSSDIKMVDGGRDRLYFCVSVSEKDGDRIVSYDGVEYSGSETEKENLALHVIDEVIYEYRSWSWNRIKWRNNIVQNVWEYLLSSGVKDIKGVDIAQERDEFINAFDLSECKDLLIKSPIFKELKTFIGDMYNAQCKVFRVPKVFPGVKDTQLLPLGFFDAKDFSLNVPGRQQNSTNVASLNFYGKYFLHDGGILTNERGNGRDLELVLRRAVSYTPYSRWVYVEPECSAYKKDAYKNSYGTY